MPKSQTITPDTQAYPHTVSETVTDSELAAHYTENPGMYHEQLRPHVDAFLAERAVQSTVEQAKVVEAKPERTLGEVYRLMRYDEDNEDIEFTDDEARGLIELNEGYAYFVGVNLKRFGELSNDTAITLLEHGQADAVFKSLDKFPTLSLNNDLALKILDMHLGARTIGHFLRKFTGLEGVVAQALVDGGYIGFTVLSQFDSFTLDAREILIEKLIQQPAGPMYFARLLKEASKTIESDRLVELCSESGSLSGVTNQLRLFNSLSNESLTLLIDDTLSGNHIGGEMIINYLHIFRNVSEVNMQRLRDLTGKDWLEPKPEGEIIDGKEVHQNKKVVDAWYGAMSYAYLEGGFSKASIGHVIRLRIEGGVEKGIHDASQWLSEFNLPGNAYDAQAILRDRKRADFDPDSYGALPLSDLQQEDRFFDSLVDADKELLQRLNFSAKPGTAQVLFTQPQHQLLYEALVQDSNGQPYYKSDSFSYEDFEQRAIALAKEYTDSAVGTNKDTTTNPMNIGSLTEEIDMMVGEMLDTHYEPDVVGPKVSISVVMSDLKQMGQRREAYIRDTQNWLIKHATSPHERLTKVWKDRPRALLYGVQDSASAIEAWQRINGLKQLVKEYEETNKLAELDLTADEILGDDAHSKVSELARVMASSDVVEVMAFLKKSAAELGDTPQVLPADSVDITLEDVEISKTKPFTFDVTSKSDVRGYTVGYDTGCCMTYGGASENCIAEGYTNPNTGFMALYGPDKRLTAQSFWYVNPDHPDILVLDNIEANEGRDFERVIELYKAGLADYLAKHGDTNITRVHVGTGYTDVNLSQLQSAETIPGFEGVYTDAEHQKLLLDLVGTKTE